MRTTSKRFGWSQPGRAMAFGAVLLTVMVMFSGCGAGAKPAAETRESAVSSLPTASSVATEGSSSSPSAPPPDSGGAQAASVELPSLPIGGNTDPDPADATHQCVQVNWIVAQDAAKIPAGVQVRVSGAVFSPRVFTISGSGCGGSGAPSCSGYTFTTTNQRCVLAVAPNGAAFDRAGASPFVSVTGRISCVAPDDVCHAFLAAVGAEHNLRIPIDPPPSPSPDTSTSASPSSVASPGAGASTQAASTRSTSAPSSNGPGS